MYRMLYYYCICVQGLCCNSCISWYVLILNICLEVSSANYCITLFFRRMLILRFPYVKNSLHFNFADFPFNCIK